MADPQLVDQVAQILTTNSGDSDARDQVDQLFMQHGPAAVTDALQHVQNTIRNR